MENQHCKHCGAPDAPNWYYDSDCYFDGERTRSCYKRENKRLRAELLACCNVLPGIEQLQKLPDLIRSGTVADTIHAFTLMQSNRIKRLEEELGNAYAEMRKQRPGIKAVFDRSVWEKAKETPHA